MRVYRVGDAWVSEEQASKALAEWVEKYGHLCYGINGPSRCCPVAHGAPADKCTCLNPNILESREEA